MNENSLTHTIQFVVVVYLQKDFSFPFIVLCRIQSKPLGLKKIAENFWNFYFRWFQSMNKNLHHHHQQIHVAFDRKLFSNLFLNIFPSKFFNSYLLHLDENGCNRMSRKVREAGSSEAVCFNLSPSVGDFRSWFECFVELIVLTDLPFKRKLYDDISRFNRLSFCVTVWALEL